MPFHLCIDFFYSVSFFIQRDILLEKGFNEEVEELEGEEENYVIKSW